MNSHRRTLTFVAMISVGASFLIGPRVVAAPSPDACALLTQAEVGAALGVAVDAGEPLRPGDTRFCTWREHGQNEIQARNVQVSFMTER